MQNKWGSGNNPTKPGPYSPFDHLTETYRKYASKVGLNLLHQETEGPMKKLLLDMLLLTVAFAAMSLALGACASSILGN